LNRRILQNPLRYSACFAVKLTTVVGALIDLPKAESVTGDEQKNSV